MFQGTWGRIDHRRTNLMAKTPEIILFKFLIEWQRRAGGIENYGNQIDSRKQFQLDLDKIKGGEDTRTTLMIKNIPNK